MAATPAALVAMLWVATYTATAPGTCGAAMLVPVIVQVRGSVAGEAQIRHVDRMVTPGAAISSSSVAQDANGPEVRARGDADHADAVVQRPDNPGDLGAVAVAVQVGRAPAVVRGGTVDAAGNVQVRVGGVDAAVDDRHVDVDPL